LKILLNIPHIKIPSNRGASTHTFELSNSLIEECHEVVLTCNKNLGIQERKNLTIYENNLPSLNYSYPLLNHYSYKLLKKIISKEEPDVIHDRIFHFGYSGIKAANEHKIPCGAYIPGNLLHNKQYLFPSYPKFLNKWIKNLEKAKILFPSSNSLADTISYEWNIQTNSHPLSLGANTEKFKPVKKDNEIFVIGFVGEFAPWHDIETLLLSCFRLKFDFQL